MNAEPQRRGNRAVGTVAATASVAALACGVCCVLPLAIPAAMLGMFGGTIAWFAQAYSWLTPIAVAAVVAGWLWVAYQSKRSGKRPARATLVIMHNQGADKRIVSWRGVARLAEAGRKHAGVLILR